MPLTEDARAQRRAADAERLKQAAQALLTTDGWQNWVTVRSRNGLARYSINNQLLIAMQAPHATYIAGFRAFLDLGRCVRKGETAIRILAPIVARKKDEPKGDIEKKPIGFRAVPVFDASQTEPLPGHDPVPLELESQPISGDSHQHLIPTLQTHAAKLGYTVTFDTTGAAAGWCDHKTMTIVISDALPPNAQVRTLVHELAHAHGITYKTYNRPQAEVLVDTVTHIVLSTTGLDTSGETIPYITGWGEEGALDAISKYAQTIDEVASTLETVIAANAAPPMQEPQVNC